MIYTDTYWPEFELALICRLVPEDDNASSYQGETEKCADRKELYQSLYVQE